MATSPSSEPDNLRSLRFSAFILAVVLVFLFQVGYAIAVFYRFPAMETRGQFGNLFGGLNALFTGLAFAGLIYTILLQRDELKLQRDELQLTRKELHDSANYHEA